MASLSVIERVWVWALFVRYVCVRECDTGEWSLESGGSSIDQSKTVYS